MRQFLILAALAALCAAAPADNREVTEGGGFTRPSPINPDIISDPKPKEKIVVLDDSKLNRQKRDEHAPAKADSGHHALSHDVEKPVGAHTQEAVHHDAKQTHKRETPVKPASGHEGHEAQSHDLAKKPVGAHTQEGVHHDAKQTHKRETPVKPAGVQAHDAHSNAHVEKPAGVKAQEQLHHDPKKVAAAPTSDHQHHHRRRRDIPVPTVIKSTPKPKEEEVKPHVEDLGTTTSTGHPATRDHPVPVAELFNKSKAKDSSEKFDEHKA
ncbi:uncharacterized protein LOC115632226 [Scaptodrosophila lebanonensis]|uniref:Uncharacterized protein LOC115632226 n=1 Tax=Drosophila lebanonensis TaxID=7225 RepID=A0A6J2UAU8_DROLE|nr:uncharacterized protein LOC115632226 [Scaptodrosophila lebanonensis]